MPQSSDNGSVPEPKSTCQLRIGCAGWSISAEAKRLFPPGPTHLARYSQLFNACEINSSFYRPHKIATWQRWGESVPADFRFAVKAPRTITHDSALDGGLELLAPFLQQIAFLKQRLGPLLFQLPPSLEYAPTRARHFLSLLRANFRGDVVWEPRHSSWFGDEVDELLQEFQIARVAADPACVPSASEPAGRSSFVYFRLHGSPRRYYSPYTNDFLNALAKRVTNLRTAAEVWCVFDNTAAGFAIPNALALQTMLKAQSHSRPKAHGVSSPATGE